MCTQLSSHSRAVLHGVSHWSKHLLSCSQSAVTSISLCSISLARLHSTPRRESRGASSAVSHHSASKAAAHKVQASHHLMLHSLARGRGSDEYRASFHLVLGCVRTVQRHGRSPARPVDLHTCPTQSSLCLAAKDVQVCMPCQCEHMNAWRMQIRWSSSSWLFGHAAVSSAWQQSVM